jgi:competence protein ComGC
MEKGCIKKKHNQAGDALALVVLSLFVISILSLIGIYSFRQKEHTTVKKEKNLLMSELKATAAESSHLKEKLFKYEDLRFSHFYSEHFVSCRPER